MQMIEADRVGLLQGQVEAVATPSLERQGTKDLSVPEMPGRALEQLRGRRRRGAFRADRDSRRAGSTSRPTSISSPRRCSPGWCFRRACPRCPSTTSPRRYGRSRASSAARCCNRGRHGPGERPRAGLGTAAGNSVRWSSRACDGPRRRDRDENVVADRWLVPVARAVLADRPGPRTLCRCSGCSRFHFASWRGGRGAARAAQGLLFFRRAFCGRGRLRPAARLSESSMIPAREALALLQEGNRRFVAEYRQPRRICEQGSSPRTGHEPGAVRGHSRLFRFARARRNRLRSGPRRPFRHPRRRQHRRPSLIGSVEFAAEQFGTRLVVVLGHTKCGAIGATLQQLQRPGENQSRNLRSIVDLIRPSVEGCWQASSGTIRTR